MTPGCAVATTYIALMPLMTVYALDVNILGIGGDENSLILEHWNHPRETRLIHRRRFRIAKGRQARLRRLM